MVIPGVTTLQLNVLTGVCLTAAWLIPGSTQSVCNTSVDSLDLGCLLWWDCPQANDNTSYTVQTKTQGDPWRDVPGCVFVSSQSCDVSQDISDFELYHMLRLGVHLAPGTTVWTQPCKFDYSDFTFSPPSVSVSLRGDVASVQVQFPCATSRRCPPQGCCPLSAMIDLWTTVTVYSQLNVSNYQTRTVWTQELVPQVEFQGLLPGQDYCAVANFSFRPRSFSTSSPSSQPQCVHTAAKPGLLLPFLLGLGISLVLLVTISIFFLIKRKQAAPVLGNLPKTPAPASLAPVPGDTAPVDPDDIFLEVLADHSSIALSP